MSTPVAASNTTRCSPIALEGPYPSTPTRLVPVDPPVIIVDYPCVWSPFGLSKRFSSLLNPNLLLGADILRRPISPPLSAILLYTSRIGIQPFQSIFISASFILLLFFVPLLFPFPMFLLHQPSRPPSSYARTVIGTPPIPPYSF